MPVLIVAIAGAIVGIKLVAWMLPETGPKRPAWLWKDKS